MNKTIGFLITVSLLMTFGGCVLKGQQNLGTKTAVYHKLSVEEAKKVLDEDSSTILLDVRAKAEFSENHIVGATSLPLPDIEANAATWFPHKDALILVYCRSGVRSKAAANLLVSMGYTRVYDIGGIKDWPYDTEPSQQ